MEQVRQIETQIGKNFKVTSPGRPAFKVEFRVHERGETNSDTNRGEIHTDPSWQAFKIELRVNERGEIADDLI